MVKVSFRGLIPALILASSLPLPAQETVLVLHPNGDKFLEAVKGLREGLGSGFQVVDRDLGKDAGVEELASEVRARAPRAVVLMDNGAIRLWKEYQQKTSDTTLPSVSLMGVLVEKAMAGVRNGRGINYEVPAVTSFVNLRSLVGQPLRRVGVVHRASLEDFIRKQSAFCRNENIEIVPFRVDDRSDAAASLRSGLEDLLGRRGVDALWVLNDNFFLTPKLLRDVWLPVTARYRKPVVVGVESLVQSSLGFGVFAVLPDHYALGSQAANLLLEIQDEGWSASGHGVDQPLSVLKYLNAGIAKRSLRIDEEHLKEIDRLVE